MATAMLLYPALPAVDFSPSGYVSAEDVGNLWFSFGALSQPQTFGCARPCIMGVCKARDTCVCEVGWQTDPEQPADCAKQFVVRTSSSGLSASEIGGIVTGLVLFAVLLAIVGLISHRRSRVKIMILEQQLESVTDGRSSEINLEGPMMEAMKSLQELEQRFARSDPAVSAALNTVRFYAASRRVVRVLPFPLVPHACCCSRFASPSS